MINITISKYMRLRELTKLMSNYEFFNIIKTHISKFSTINGNNIISIDNDITYNFNIITYELIIKTSNEKIVINSKGYKSI